MAWQARQGTYPQVHQDGQATTTQATEDSELRPLLTNISAIERSESHKNCQYTRQCVLIATISVIVALGLGICLAFSLESKGILYFSAKRLKHFRG